MMTTINFKTTRIQSLDVRYFDEGEGAPILFLHGWGANITLITPLAERLYRLGYRVIGLDLAGFGGSAVPLEAWTVFEYVGQVLAFADARDLGRFHLFGHSFGGRLSLILGADHGERVDKLILANSAGIVEPAPLSGRLRLKSYKALRDGLYKLGAHRLADDLRQIYNARYGSSDFQQVDGIMRETFVKVIQQDLRDYARRIEAPTLLFWGDRDEETPLRYGQQFEALIADAGLVVFEGAGHYSYLEYAERCAQVMDYFFKQGGE